jgi:hypothetical protein
MSAVKRYAVIAFEQGAEIPEEQKYPDRLGAVLVAEAKAKSGRYVRVSVFELTSERISTWESE